MPYVRSLGLGEIGDLSSDIALKQRQLNDLSRAIVLAQKAGQIVAANQMIAQRSAIQAEINRLINQQRDQDMPTWGGVMAFLDPNSTDDAREAIANERAKQASGDIRRAGVDLQKAKSTKNATATQIAQRDLQSAKARAADVIAEGRSSTTPSGFQLGVGDYLGNLTKLLPWLAVGYVAAIALPSIIAARGRRAA